MISHKELLFSGVGVVFVMTDFFFRMSHNDRTLITKHVFIVVWNICSLRPFCWRVLSDCTTTNLTPQGMTWWLHSNMPTWEMIWKKKKFLHLIIHILPEQRHISGRIFPCRYSSIKKDDSMRSTLTHLLTIENLSTLLDYGRKSQNYVRIDTYYCKPKLLSWR